MTQARRLAAPAFLFLCLMLGGSAQGVWGNAVLRLIAIILIAWAAIHTSGKRLPAPAKPLIWLAAGAIGYGILQLIPLPYAFWTAMPGREAVVAGFELLAIPPGPMPLSLAPYETLATMLALLPPLGMLAVIVTFDETSRDWLTVAVIAGTVSGVLLGVMQVSSADPVASPWYLYAQSNFGVATGFFANSNHMASLLLASIPFIAALGAIVREGTEDRKKRAAILAICGSGMLAVVLGLLLNGSLAGYGLAIPVLLASLAMVLDGRSPLLRWWPAGIAVATIAAIAFLWMTPASSQFGGATASVTSRQQLFEQSVNRAVDYAPFGSGLGTFEQVYRIAEDPGLVDRFYVNHAHNDYLELAVETGVAGLVLILLFLAWWVAAVRRVLRSPVADKFALGGAIISATILIHSLVDFPLRTAAISSLFAACLGLMITPGRAMRGVGDIRPARHLVVG